MYFIMDPEAYKTASLNNLLRTAEFWRELSERRYDMPCHVDTSQEDARWSIAFGDHHRAVEKILEEVLDGRETVENAKARYAQARAVLAGSYRRIWGGLYSPEALEGGVKKILEGKR